jgi:hypothetical protein
VKLNQKVTLVAGGYILAVLVAIAAVALHTAMSNVAGGQASGGMSAFGDTVLFMGVFGVVALIPTGAALFFLRPYLLFWKLLSALGLVVAAMGVTAAILHAVGRNATVSPLATLAGLSVLRILVSPILALAFFVCAALSPHRVPRLAFFTAAAMEAAVSVYGGAVWIAFQLHHGT